MILFAGGSANGASVIYNPTTAEGDTITLTFAGHSATFDFGLVNVAANQGLEFADGSHLLIGGPRTEQYDGGAGNDALFGGDGNDTLNGHDGANVLQGNGGDDNLRAGSGADTIYGGQGADIIFSGVGLAGEAGDFVNGNKGDDSISGGAGNDILLGGQGNDLILGGAGNDYLSGDRGDDRLDGGAGADIFHAVADGGTDRIDDFNLAEGDRVELDPGTTFQLAQVGADTVITLSGGGQLVLLGVDMTTLHGDWIFGG